MVTSFRKGGLLLNNVLGIVGACLMGCTKIAHSYEILFFGRFIIGVNCGLNTSLVPMYISEIAPLNLRGGLGTVNQLAVTVGLLVSQVLGIEQILGTDHGWPVLLGLAICPAILQLVLLPFCPESPRCVEYWWIKLIFFLSPKFTDYFFISLKIFADYKAMGGRGKEGVAEAES